MSQIKRKQYRLYHFVQNAWYHRHWWNYFFWPFSIVFFLASRLRRWFYEVLFRRPDFSIPVIVIGNLTVGGTGKTPLVIYLAEQLQARGFRPAIVSRGYGRQSCLPLKVEDTTGPEEVGDEPLLIYRRTGCPVFVCKKRNLAIKRALEQTSANVIIADDGLQHYAMRRHIEIVVLDGTLRFGNGLLLPAGPLREPISRLKEVDFVVNNGDQRENEVLMTFQVEKTIHCSTGKTVSLETFIGQTVHAVAGIGNPKRFFNTLIAMGIKVISHEFPDHHFYKPSDLQFEKDLPILMTEKDQVKCTQFMTDRMYVVAIRPQLADASWIEKVVAKLSTWEVKHAKSLDKRI